MIDHLRERPDANGADFEGLWDFPTMEANEGERTALGSKSKGYYCEQNYIRLGVTFATLGKAKYHAFPSWGD